MRSFFDGRCAKCDCRIGWFGELKDKPDCPRCGHKMTQAEIYEADRVEAIMNRMEKEMLDD